MAFDWSKSPNDVATSTAASSGLGGAAAGALAGGAETYIQYKLNQKEAQKAFERQQKLLRQEYLYNQQAQRNSVTNMVQSAKDAGLSPVAMTGQGFSPAGASAGGVAAASVSRPELSPDKTMAQNAQVAQQVDLMGQQIKDLQASIDLKDAQKKNVDESTRGTRIDNNRKDDADSSATENMREHLQGVSDALKKLGQDTTWIDQKISDIDNGDRSYTTGALEANRLFEAYRKEHTANIPIYSEAQFQYKVAELKRQNPKIAEAIATLPMSDQGKLEADIVKLYAEAYRLQTSAQLDASNIDYLETQQKALVQRMKSEYLRDPRLMLSNEDYAHFASWLGMDVYEKGMGVLEGLIKARAGALNAESLQEMKQEGAETLQEMKDASKAQTKTREFFNRKGEVTGGYTEKGNSYAPDYKQKASRKKRRR